MQKTFFEKVTRRAMISGGQASKEVKNTRFDPSQHVSSIPYVRMEDVDLPYHFRDTDAHAEGSCLDPECHDRYFRDAMEMAIVNGAAVFTCNMDKCRAIHAGHMISMVDRELSYLGALLMAATARGKVNEETNLRRRLSAIGEIPDLTNITTPEELKALWPAGVRPIII